MNRYNDVVATLEAGSDIERRPLELDAIDRCLHGRSADSRPILTGNGGANRADVDPVLGGELNGRDPDRRQLPDAVNIAGGQFGDPLIPPAHRTEQAV
jgi:hypothetical protein